MPFSITILGSSGALPALGRFPSSQYINIDKHHFLVDAGEGTQIQLARFNVSPHRIEAIFISHLHGDHYLGLMGLLFSMHLNKRTTDLHLFAFKGLQEIILLQLKYSKSALSYTIVFHALEENNPSVIFESETITISTIPLLHKIPCNGFLFKEKPKQRRIDRDRLPAGMLLQHSALLKQGQDVIDDDGKVLYRNIDHTLPARPSRSYAYCSDTAYHEPILPLIQDVDILYHESTFTKDDLQKAIDTKHSTAEQAAIIAQKSNAKKLLIGHFSARYHDTGVLLTEARVVFPETYLANEGESFNISE